MKEVTVLSLCSQGNIYLIIRLFYDLSFTPLDFKRPMGGTYEMRGLLFGAKTVGVIGVGSTRQEVQ
jgi:hypothetical protein